MDKRITTTRTVKVVRVTKTVRTVRTVKGAAPQGGITVVLPDVPHVPAELRGTAYTVRRVLTDGSDNPKLLKSNRAGTQYRTWGLTLAPARMSGRQVCGSASPGCTNGCLAVQGHARVFPTVNVGRIAKTLAYFDHRGAFEAMLRREMGAAVRLCDRTGLVAAVRPNMLSDIPWEAVFPWLFADHPGVQFYDYTKHFRRMTAWCSGRLPPNYHLTFSRSETNEADCLRVLRAGGNVAVVFRTKAMPPAWHGFPVLNGDETDMRFADPPGHVVGLYAKGTATRDETGFVVPTRLYGLPTLN